jgi:hypothetical protein
MSISNITYLKDIIPNKFFLFSNYESVFLYFTDILEIKLFLQELEEDKVYVATFELIVSDLTDDPPVITLSEPILITKNSRSITISNFIRNQLIRADNNYGLDYELLMEMKGQRNNPPYIFVKYNSINLF